MGQRAVIAVINDTHTGSALAPFPGDAWELADGNCLMPNAWQQTLGAHWEECWRLVGAARRRSRLIIWHVGDATEGVHHDMMQIHSNLAEEQERMHLALMRQALALAHFNPRTDSLTYFCGTPAHGDVERIARELLDADKEDGRLATPYLLASVNGCLFDVAHEGFSEGTREWTRDNTMRAYLTSRYLSSLKHGRPMPRYVLRAHRHRWRVADVRDDDGRIISEGMLLPAWKLRDAYIYRKYPEGISQVGMVVFEVEADGASRWRGLTMRVEQDEVMEL